MSFWDDKKPPKENFATKDDIAKLTRQVEKMSEDSQPVRTDGATKKIVRMMKRGIGDIAESMNEPASERRPKIARMMAGKPPIARTRPKNPIAGANAGIKRRRISDAPLD